MTLGSCLHLHVVRGLVGSMQQLERNRPQTTGKGEPQGSVLLPPALPDPPPPHPGTIGAPGRGEAEGKFYPLR